MSGNMTIDGLAGIIKGEFDNIGGTIKEIKDEMTKGFKKLEDGQENIDRYFI